MEPSQHLLAALEIPSPVQMPYAIQWQRPLSLLSIHLPLLRVGEVSMYPSANAFLSKALVKFKSQDHARGQGPPWGCLRISLLMMIDVLHYSFLQENWLPLSAGYRGFNSCGQGSLTSVWLPLGAGWCYVCTGKPRGPPLAPEFVEL